MNKTFSNRTDQKIAMITAYDYPTAKLAAECGADILLVGDSLGPNVLGYESVNDVTTKDICHHTEAVRRGAPESFIISDLPWDAMDSPAQTLMAAEQIIKSGADAVKLEIEEGRKEFIDILINNKIQVCAHIGYTPQTPGLPVSVQGKELNRAVELVKLARLSQEHGAFMIVLELMPAELAEYLTEELTIPTIGIGAGPFCSGQVQVWYDISGFSEKVFRHAKLFSNSFAPLKEAFSEYIQSVHDGHFPRMNNCTSIKDELMEQIEEQVKGE